MGWYSDKQNQQRLNDEAQREAFRIFTNQQTIYDSIRSKLVAGAEDADFLVIYKANGNLRIVVTCPKQRSRMIKLGLVHASVVPAHEENTYLTDKGMRVYKRLEHAFRGTTYDPLWGRAAMAKKNQIMTPKNDVYRKGIDDSIELRKTDEASLQSFVKGLRTAWSQRPRISRFTIRSWIYRCKIWISQTTPEIPMIDWSELKLPKWTDEDRKNQRQVWHDSDLLAFWLCPDGIEAGIEAHDEFLRICEKRGIKSVEKRKEVISEITGIALPKPKKTPEKASNAIDEILGHLQAMDDDPNEEMIEIHEFGKSPKTVNKYPNSKLAVSDGYDTKYFTNEVEALKYAEMVTRRLQSRGRKEEIEARSYYKQKHLNTRYYY